MAIKGVTWILGFLVLLVVVFYLVGGIIPEAGVAADRLGAENSANCAAVGCYWNASGVDKCVNVSVAPSGDCATTLPLMPLASLFASGGIVFLLIAIALLLFVIARAKLGKK